VVLNVPPSAVGIGKWEMASGKGNWKESGNECWKAAGWPGGRVAVWKL